MTPIRVLFVCTHNSARSQLAEALLGRLGGDGFEVRSAGRLSAGLSGDGEGEGEGRALSER